MIKFTLFRIGNEWTIEFVIYGIGFNHGCYCHVNGPELCLHTSLETTIISFVKNKVGAPVCSTVLTLLTITSMFQ